MKTDAKDLFARAHEQSGKRREAFLSEACGDDAELRLEVQRLLVQAERADSFFADAEGETIFAENYDSSYAESEGDVVGPYNLLQQIGEGGFGTVWMAEQSEPISRMVAIKVVKAGMDTKQVLARFEAERQALAMMDHPNIAKVLEAGATAAGRPYFAMELVKGIPITQFCDEQKFGPRQRLELFKDVCSAVNHAHQKGIIHRDLKPSNVMVTLAADVPVVKVIDFGIAKATQNKLTENTLFTRFEQFLGTPVYMSPEQAAMSSIDVDTRSDIYSLGVLLYELLAGAPPFDQRSLLSAGYDEMRRIIAEEEPPMPSTRLTQTRAGTRPTNGSAPKNIHVSASALKGEVDWIVMKAIEKDRTRRYETANAFAADIERFLADEPVQAGAPSAAYKFKKFARRNKAAFAISLAILGALCLGLAFSLWSLKEANRQRQKAEFARSEVQANANKLERQNYLIHLANADRAWFDEDINLTEYELEVCPPNQRGWEWNYHRNRIDSLLPFELPADTVPLLTRDGSRLVAVTLHSADDGNRIRIFDVLSGESLHEFPYEYRPLRKVALSSDERYLAGCAWDGSIRIWDLATKEHLCLVAPAPDHESKKYSFRFIAFSPDGRKVVANGRGLQVFDTESGALEHELEPAHGGASSISFAPNTPWIALGFGDVFAKSLLFHLITGEYFYVDDVGWRHPAFSPDGRWIAAGHTDGGITLWEWDHGKALERAERTVPPEHPDRPQLKLPRGATWSARPTDWGNRIRALAFSTDGQRLVSSTSHVDAVITVWDLSADDVWETGGKEIAALAARKDVQRLTLLHGEDRLMAGNRMWDFSERPPEPLSEDAVELVRFSPDGAWIATGSKETGIKILDAKSGVVIQEIPGTSSPCLWMPDASSHSLLTGVAGGGHSFAVYDAITGTRERELTFPGEPRRHDNLQVRYGVSRDGRQLVSLEGISGSHKDPDLEVMTWNLQPSDPGASLRLELPPVDKVGSWYPTISLSPHGRWAFIEYDGHHLWDLKTGQKWPQLDVEGWIRRVRFTNDERQIYVVMDENQRRTLKLLDLERNEVLQTFKRFTGAITALAASPDGRNVVTADTSGKVIVWDVESASPLVTVFNDPGVQVLSLDWSPDKQRIAAGCKDGTAPIWTLPIGQE